MVRGMVSCAILGATVLSFNLIVVAPSGAATGTLSTWMAMDGNIQYVANPTIHNQFGWGNEGTTTGAPACPSGVTGGISLSGTHGLFNCGSPDSGFNPNAPLNANGDSSIISRDFITDPVLNSQNSQGCPLSKAQDSTAFTSSAKFGKQTVYNQVGASNVNGKDDLSNAYFVSRTQQANNLFDTAPGDRELFFGLERAGSGGDDAVDLEFLQGGASLGGCTGPLTENRSQGDFAIEFDWVNGGGVPSPTLFVWQCDPAHPNTVSIATSCNVDGPHTNPLYTSPGYVAATIPPGSIVLAENGTTDNTCGGWVCANGNVPATQFVEGGIDLNGVGVQSSCASSVVAASHESPAFDSNMTDFVGPGPFSTCPTPPTTTTPQTSGDGTLGNSWHDLAQVQGESTDGAPTGTVDFFSCSPSVLAAHSATTCNNTIGTEIPSGGGITNPVPLTPGANDLSTATSPSITPDAVGKWCFAGYYSGEAGHYSASSDTSSGECFTVGPDASTTTTQQSLNPSGGEGTVVIGPGATWHDVATVDGTLAGGAPTGTVSFYECGPTSGASTCDATVGNKLGADVTLTQVGSTVNSSAPSINVPVPSKIGTYCFAAVYHPATDPPANYSTSSDNTASAQVADANECVDVTKAVSTTTTQQSLNPTGGEGSVVIGPGVTWNDVATVAGNTAGGPPTGTVSFYECGPTNVPALCTSSTWTKIGTDVALTQVGTTDTSTATTSAGVPVPTKVGTYCFAAVYNPSTDPASNYGTSSDNTTSDSVDMNECVVVGPAHAPVTTQQSLTTSGPGSIVIGPDGTWTDTATVQGNSAGGAPTGSVFFYECGPTAGDALCTSSTWTQVGSSGVTLHQVDSTDNSSATSVSVPVPTKVGTYCFAAVYTPATMPPANYSGSSDNVTGDIQANECVQVTPAPSTTTTQQSTSATGSGSINLGGSITDLATVTGNSAGGAPAGTVTFTECGPTSSPAPCSDGTAVGTEPVTLTAGSGDASTATSPAFTPTATGTYCFAAVYTPGTGSNYLGSDDNLGGDVQSTECFLVTRPDFKVTKTDVPGNGKPVAPGSTIPYTVTIQNIGDGAGTATVTDTLPSNLTIVSPPPVCSVSGCVVTNTTGSTWTFTMNLAANGAAGDTATVTFSAQVSATDTADVVNTATITSGNCDNGQAPSAPSARPRAAVNNCSSTVTNPVPDFTVTKTDGPGNNTPVAPGSTIPYTVAIKNVGDGAGTATITDTLPAGLTLASTPAPACAATAPDTCTAGGSGSTLTFAVSLAAGNTATATFSAVVSASATGTITNTATITTGPCNTSSGCSSSVSNPIIVTAPTTTTVPPVKPAVIAFTGADIAAMLAAALALLGLGGFLVLISRRRRHAGENR